MTTEGVLKLLLGIAMMGAVGTLVAGLASFAKGAPHRGLYRNKLMYMRILFQGAAIVLFSLLLFLKGH